MKKEKKKKRREKNYNNKPLTIYLLWLTLAYGILACFSSKDGTVNNRALISAP